MIYFLLAEGFEEIEALAPLDILRRAGLEAKTVSITDAKTVTGSHGICVTADYTAAHCPGSVTAVILPGGMPGAKHLDESPVTDRYLALAKAQNALLGAICAAPFVLGKRGLLAGKEATCYPGFEGELRDARWLPQEVVTAEGVITASAMGSAEAFGLALVRVLQNAETAEKLAKGIAPYRA